MGAGSCWSVNINGWFPEDRRVQCCLMRGPSQHKNGAISTPQLCCLNSVSPLVGCSSGGIGSEGNGEGVGKGEEEKEHQALPS